MKQAVLLSILAITTSALAARPAAAQMLPTPIPQPQLSPYLFLNRGGQQGYLQYRQGLGVQQQQQILQNLPAPTLAAPSNRVTNFQANPQTTGFAPNTQTGHADVRGSAYTFMNYSHFYTIRAPAGQRPY